MAKMCRFVDSTHQTVVLVNPVLVRLMQPSQVQGTEIVFDHYHTITVVQQIEEVAKAIEGAW